MKTKDYYREVAEEIRILLLSKTLTTQSKIEVIRTKKSPNFIKIIENGKHETLIEMIKNDKFIIKVKLPSYLSKYNTIELNDREALHNFVIDKFI